MKLNSALILIIITIVGVLGVKYYFSNKASDQYNKVINSLSLECDSLEAQLTSKDSSLLVMKDNELKLIDSLTQSVSNSDKLALECNLLRTKFDNISDQLKDYPPDSSDIFLKKIAYPYIGSKYYKYNDKQVSAMHRTYLERETLQSLSDKLTDESRQLNKTIDYQNSLIIQKTAYSDIQDSINTDLSLIIQNKDKALIATKTEAKKAKTASTLKIIGVAALSLIVGFGLGN